MSGEGRDCPRDRATGLASRRLRCRSCLKDASRQAGNFPCRTIGPWASLDVESPRGRSWGTAETFDRELPTRLAEEKAGAWPHSGLAPLFPFSPRTLLRQKAWIECNQAESLSSLSGLGMATEVQQRHIVSAKKYPGLVRRSAEQAIPHPIQPVCTR